MDTLERKGTIWKSCGNRESPLEDVVGQRVIRLSRHRRRCDGLNIARGLRHSFPGSSAHFLEKEADCGLHASGRNSGVLHAGFYYSPDSLKAKFTWRGYSPADRIL